MDDQDVFRTRLEFSCAFMYLFQMCSWVWLAMINQLAQLCIFLIVLFVQTGVALLIKFYGCYDISGSLLFFMTGFGVGLFFSPLGGDFNWDFPCGFNQLLNVQL